MRSRHFFVLTAAALCVSAQYSLPPAQQATKDSANSSTVTPSNLTPSTLTDTARILQTAGLVDQRAGAPTDATKPGLLQAPTKLTAVDGQIVLSNITDSNSTAPHGPGRRARSDYYLVFNETATKDAAVHGIGYLTFTVVSNASYAQGRAECMDFCDRTPRCVFVNIYYEFNNPYLDFLFSEKSNLKCVAYGDPHNRGKNKLGRPAAHSSPPSGATYIQNSTGYATVAVPTPAVPGYELVFGPSSAANSAPGYMGFAFLDKYDPSACAQLCNQRNPDPVTGGCKFFNIWRALVGGVPTTYTCAMYSIPTDESTATNTGQGSLTVSLSRGYARISHIQDGGFEDYVCPDLEDFCFGEQAPGWVGTSPTGGRFDATVFHYAPYAHAGAGVALLGSAFGSDTQPGMLKPAAPIAGLLPGRAYVVGFFYSSTYSGEDLEGPAFAEVWWNGAIAATVRMGYTPWVYIEITVTALGGGNDALMFRGGQAPAYSFIDDVNVFLA
ncbi:hypothetical protein DFH09DRAFT_1244599 [Mycena vulgaris]|nr:hypothetical protein DFH09DRAFT_1244599 [Mycena vulgaris]